MAENMLLLAKTDDNPPKKKTKIASKISEHDELITVLKEIRDVMHILANKIH
jgi:hypothetical protein